MTSKEPYRAQRIGNLRERVTFTSQGEITGYDPFGSPIYGSPIVVTVHARVEPLKGEEKVIAGGISAVWDVNIHIRHRDDIDPTWTVAHRGQTYNIVGIRNLDERRRYLSLECTAGA